MEQTSVSPRIIGQPGAWKCEAALQLQMFEKQNLKRMRRLENMQRHAKKTRQKQLRTEKTWNTEAKRLENIRRRLERKKAIERKRKAALQAQCLETKITPEKNVMESKEELLEKKIIKQDNSEEKSRQRKEKACHLKPIGAREKQEKLLQRLQPVRFTEEKKQADLRRRWAAKEKRTEFLREQEYERRKIAKIARELLTQAKSDRVSQVRKETLENRRFKIEKNYKRADHYTVPRSNFDVKDGIGLRVPAAVQAAAIQATAIVNSKAKRIDALFDSVSVVEPGGTPASREQAAAIFDRKTKSAFVRRDRDIKNMLGSFPSLSTIRPVFQPVFSPINVTKSRAWCTSESKMSTPRGSLPVVASSNVQ